MAEVKLRIPLTNNKGTVVTSKISGYIDSFIYNFPFGGRIKIMSEYGYVLFDSKNLAGIDYVPIRVKPQNIRNQSFSQWFTDKFFVNEKLFIEISIYGNRMQRFGEKKEEVVQLILRYDSTS